MLLQALNKSYGLMFLPLNLQQTLVIDDRVTGKPRLIGVAVEHTRVLIITSTHGQYLYKENKLPMRAITHALGFEPGDIRFFPTLIVDISSQV